MRVVGTLEEGKRITVIVLTKKKKYIYYVMLRTSCKVDLRATRHTALQKQGSVGCRSLDGSKFKRIQQITKANKNSDTLLNNNNNVAQSSVSLTLVVGQENTTNN